MTDQVTLNIPWFCLNLSLRSYVISQFPVAFNIHLPIGIFFKCTSLSKFFFVISLVSKGKKYIIRYNIHNSVAATAREFVKYVIKYLRDVFITYFIVNRWWLLKHTEKHDYIQVGTHCVILVVHFIARIWKYTYPLHIYYTYIRYYRGDYMVYCCYYITHISANIYVYFFIYVGVYNITIPV